MGRGRSIARWTFRVIAITVVAILAVILAVLLALRTDFGRDQVRGRLESAIGERIRGEVSVGRIEGQVLGDVVVRDLVLRDRAGAVVVAIERLRLEYGVLDLIDQRLAAELVEIDGLVVIDRGTFDTLVIRGDRPSAWTVEIEALEISGGRYRRLRGGFEELDVRDIDAAGSVSYAAGDLEAGLRYARAELGDLGAEVRGEITYAGGALSARDTAIVAGDSRLDVAAARFDPESGAFDAQFSAGVAAADVRRFVPEWRASVSVAGQVRRPEAGRRIDVDLRGRVADSEVTAALEVGLDPLAARGAIDIDGAAPSSWLAGAPPGAFDLRAELDVTGSSLEAITGTADIAAGGQLAGARFDDLAGTVELAGDAASADLRAAAIAYRDARIAGARIRATASPLSARPPIAFDIRGRRARYSEVSASELAVEGRLEAGAMSGSASARASRLRVRGADIGPLRARVRLADRERIWASLRAGLREGYAVALEGTARLGDRATAIRISHLDLRTEKVRWRGGGSLVIRDRGSIAIEDLALRSTAGAIEASGELGPGTERGALHLTATGVDLGAVIAAIPGPRALPLEGALDASLRLSLSPAAPLSIDGRVAFRRLAWDGRAPAVSGELVLDSSAGTTRARLDVRAPRTGAAAVTAIIGLPEAPLEPSSWTDFGRQRVEEVEVALEAIDVGRVAALLGEPIAAPEGTLSGSIELVDGGERFAVDVGIVGFRGGPLRRPVVLELAGSGGRQEVEARVAVAVEGRQALRGELAIGVGLDRLWEGDLEAVKRSSLVADLEIPGLALAVLARQLELDGELRGRLAGSIAARGTVARPRAELALTVSDGAIGGIENIEARVAATVDPRRWSARARVSHRGGGALQMTGQGSSDLDAPFVADVTASDFDIAVLSPLLARADGQIVRVAGDLDLDLDVGGALTRPRVTGIARLSAGRARLRTGVESIENASLEVAITRSQIAARGRAESRGGDVELEAEIAHVELRPRSMRAVIEADDLPVSAGPMRGEIDGRLALEGVVRGGATSIDAAFVDGVIRMPERRETRDLHPIEPPPDVRYVDAAGIAARRRAARREPPGSVLEPMFIAFTTPGGFRVISGEGVSVDGRADLDITLRAQQTTITGTVEALEGKVVLFDRQYEVRRALVAFDGDTPIVPRIDVALAHSFEDLDLFIAVSGTTREPEVELSSSPSIYSRSELLGFVLGAQPGQPGGPGGIGSGAVGLASSFVVGQLESLIATPLPFDTVRFGADEDTPGGISSVTVGRWISDDVFIAYQRELDPELDENSNEAVIEYHFLPHWVIEGVIGDRGNGSVDVLWVRRFD